MTRKVDPKPYVSPVLPKGGGTRENHLRYRSLRDDMRTEQKIQKMIRDNPSQVEPYYPKPGSEEHRTGGGGIRLKKKPGWRDPHQFDDKPLPIKPTKGYKPMGFPRVTNYAKPRNKRVT